MTTHCISMIKNFNLSLKIKEEEEEEAISMEKQGIMSILDKVDPPSSNGEEDHHEQLIIKDQPIKTFDIWGSILSSSKNEDSSNKLIPTTPYVHPLVKRSTSSLSKESLEICTESLGSETGSSSDCFPSSTTFEHKDSDDNKDNHHYHHHQQQQYSVISKSSEDFQVYNSSKRLISSCRSFPPSLPSVHMQSRRQNGRLILEAASVSPKNSLHAQRLDGHLLLTFINRNDTELEIENLDDEVEVFEQVFDDNQEVEGNETPHSDGGGSDEEESEEEGGEGVVMEHSPRLSSEVTNVNRAALVMLEKKIQPTWSKCTVRFSMTSGYFDFNSRFNNSINVLITGEEKDTSNYRECYTCPSSFSQSLPSSRDMAEVILAPPATGTSLNAYEYFWRKKPTVASIVNNSTINKYYYNNKQGCVATTTNGTDTKAKSTTKIASCTQDLVLIRGNKSSTMNNNLGPLLRSCKEPRRSLIIWEPYCISTS